MNRKYRKTIIAGNWKMNKTATQTKAYAEALKLILPKTKWCEVVLCVPFVNIPAAIKAFRDTRISIGAQDVSADPSGAFTGQVSAEMLKDLGVKYVIIGHSECRKEKQDTDRTINQKVRAALDAGLSPIICVGESLEQRELGVTSELIALQVKTALSGVSADRMRRVIMAYEPIWAIGTGLSASAEQAGEVCEFIRTLIRKQYGARVARSVTIQYGGSMDAGNGFALLAQPDVDGGLVGGASLSPESFMTIINAANQDS